MVDSQYEAVKAMSGTGGLSAKFFRERRKKKKGRKKDRWRKQGKEGGRNRFESWLTLEAAAQRIGGSPGLSPGIENPSRQDGVHRRTREPGWPGSSVSKGFPSSPRALSAFQASQRASAATVPGARVREMWPEAK